VDLDLYTSVNGLAFHHRAIEEVSRLLGEDGPLLFLALLAGLFLAYGKWRSRSGRHGAAAAGVSVLVGLGAAHVVASLWDRPRPYEAHPGDAHLLIAPSPDPSFPSDHATGAFAIAIAILLHHRRAGWLSLALATLIAASRVALGTHYPSDVLAGAVLGGGAAVLLWASPLRRVVDVVADWAAGVYEGLVERARGGAASRA
jgi:undecaprenyl-diphosphatase